MPRHTTPPIRTVSTRRRAADPPEESSRLREDEVTDDHMATETSSQVRASGNSGPARPTETEFFREELRRLQQENSRLLAERSISSTILSHEAPLMSYDGKSDWEEYLTHVEVVSTTNNWDEIKKAQRVASSLRGTALSVLNSLPLSDRTQWVPLILALSHRFGQETLAPKWHTELQNRRQRPGESVVDLSNDIERLTRLAHPGWPDYCKNQMGVRAFLNALSNDQIRGIVAAAAPVTLQDALYRAQLVEASMQAGGSKVREGCYECGQKGHYQNRCPAKQKEN